MENMRKKFLFKESVQLRDPKRLRRKKKEKSAFKIFPELTGA